MTLGFAGHGDHACAQEFLCIAGAQGEPRHGQLDEKSLPDTFPLRKAEVVRIAKIQGFVEAQNPL